MPAKFKAESPDPFLKKGEDMAPAKFGHLNEILRMTQREFADDTAELLDYKLVNYTVNHLVQCML